jgi:hypothetical protein
VEEAIAEGNPALSVDTKKKELVGDFKNGGQRAIQRRSKFTTSWTPNRGV